MLVLPKMNLKIFFQVIITLIIFTILIVFFYSFFLNKNKKISENPNDTKISLDKKIANELVNIEYNSTDDEGNIYYLNAEKGIVETKDQQNNIIKLEGVVAIINLKDKGVINIFAKNAIYNKLDHDTLFYNDVEIDYLNNSIYANNLDVIFTKKISKIYNNVFVKNNMLNLTTDKIILDMITGDLKLQMINEKEKIKLVTKYEFIN